MRKLNARLEKLYPRVKGLSHYVQLLIEADIRTGTATEQIKEWCAVEGSNLRPPPCQGAVLGLVKVDFRDADTGADGLRSLSHMHQFPLSPTKLRDAA